MSPVAKYPRTPHLTYSPGQSGDDRVRRTEAGLIGVPLVVTEKLDGSGVCLAPENLYARTRNGPPTHPSYAALWPTYHQVRVALRDEDLDHISVFGEWCWAVHTITYPTMREVGWLHLYGVRDERDQSWWDWEKICALSERLDLPTVPEDSRITATSEEELRTAVETVAATPSRYGPDREGVVVRTVSGFEDEEFSERVGKWVRAGHDAGKHWTPGGVRRHVQKRRPETPAQTHEREDPPPQIPK